MRVQGLVDHLPPSAPQSSTIISVLAEKVGVFLQYSPKQPERKFRKLGRRNGCESIVKKRGEYVKFREVHVEYKSSEDSVASQANVDHLPRSPVSGSFSKP